MANNTIDVNELLLLYHRQAVENGLPDFGIIPPYVPENTRPAPPSLRW